MGVLEITVLNSCSSDPHTSRKLTLNGTRTDGIYLDVIGVRATACTLVSWLTPPLLVV